jgi:hypothetical protein
MDARMAVPTRRRSSTAIRRTGREPHPQEHLRGFKGILQADGYGGFTEIYRGGEVVEAACMAHARRKFWDAHEKTKSALSREALERIAAFYKIEGNRPISACGCAPNTSHR